MWLHIFATLCKFFCKEIGNCKLIVLLLPLRFLDFILPSRNFFYRKRRTFGRVSDILFEINCVNIWSGYTSDGNVIRGGKLERGERRIELVMSFVHYIPQVCYQRIRWWKVKLTFKKREIKRKRLIANKQIDCEKFKFLYFLIFFLVINFQSHPWSNKSGYFDFFQRKERVFLSPDFSKDNNFIIQFKASKTVLGFDLWPFVRVKNIRTFIKLPLYPYSLVYHVILIIQS